MNTPSGLGALALALAALAGAGPIGCDNGKFDVQMPWAEPAGPRHAQQKVPPPVDLLLPKAIRIHPFTGTRAFDEAGGIKGIDVRIEAIDAYGDSTKAFGTFQFALYRYRPSGTGDQKGQRVYTWVEPLLDAKKNLLHWDNITRAYKFKLQWYQPIAVGTRFVLTAAFSSPFTERKFAERVFVSGQ